MKRLPKSIKALLRVLSRSAPKPSSGARRRKTAALNMIEESELFDANWYLSAYDDLRRSRVDPLRHYLDHGWREGRDPGPRFSTSGYLRFNPDVGASGRNPLLHYLEHGRFEGRTDGVGRTALRTALRCTDEFGPASEVVRFPSAPRPPLDWLRARDVSADSAGAFRIDGHFAAWAKRGAEWVAVTATFDALAGRRLPGGEQPRLTDGACGLLTDSWFTDLATLRMRYAVGAHVTLVVRAFQHDGMQAAGAVSVGEGAVRSDLDTVEFRLCNPFFPVLVVITDATGLYLAAFIVAFPSLCRSGPHYPELLAGGDVDPVATGERFGRHLLALRAGQGVAAVRCIEVDTSGDDGRGWLYRRPLQDWLKQVAACPVLPAGSPDGDGQGKDDVQHFLRSAVSVDQVEPWRSSLASGRLVLKGDMLPSIAQLVASEDDAGEARCRSLALVAPDACSSVSIVGWPSDADMALAGWGLRGASPAGSQATTGFGALFALRPWPTLALHAAEMLCPVVASDEREGAARRDRIVVVTARGECPLPIALAALDLLARQEGASRFDVTFLDEPGPDVRERAAMLFGRVAVGAADDLRLDSAAVVWVAPGVLLHDSRTVAILEALLTDAEADSVGCATIITPESAAADVAIFSLGEVSAFAADGTPAADGGQSELEMLWRSSYPVAQAGDRICLVRRAALDHPAPGMTQRHLFTSETSACLTWHGDPPASPFQERLARGTALEIRRVT